jgi:DNA-binding transcriptional regulator YiaG
MAPCGGESDVVHSEAGCGAGELRPSGYGPIISGMKKQQKSGRAAGRRAARKDALSGVGQRISEIVKRVAGTTEKFAFEIGVNPETVRKWRNERSVPNGRQLAAIAVRYGLSVDWMLGLEGPGNEVSYSFFEPLCAELHACDRRFTPEKVRLVVGEPEEVWDRLLRESGALLVLDQQARGSVQRLEMQRNQEAFVSGVLADFKPTEPERPWWPSTQRDRKRSRPPTISVGRGSGTTVGAKRASTKKR